jgi:hypothetical protein
MRVCNGLVLQKRLDYVGKLFALLFVVLSCCFGQTAQVAEASAIYLPSAIVDGNSPSVWVDGQLKIFTSTGDPILMGGTSLFDLWQDNPPVISPKDHFPIWIESVWRDDDGTIYAWYHHEPQGMCGGKLTAPEIGALVSKDNAQTFQDLGIVLSSADPVNCGAQNGFFAGGHGDFSVVLDRERSFFYFLFGNYGGPAANQGIAVARMAFEDRARPAGAVYKLALGAWTEPGIGGEVTPIVPVRSGWERADTDAFWGPAVHWNTALERYVVLLNHACCKSDWPQEGIYIMFGKDLSDPATWTTPSKLLDASQIGFAPGYYPQVMGIGPGETDSLAGDQPRLFIKGVSKWQIFFGSPQPEDPVVVPDDPEPSDAVGRPKINK